MQPSPGIDSPLLTIATVCRNPGPALRATLDSLVALKEPWVRYVVVDGASDDGTAEILRGQPASVDAYLSEPDAGIYDAMNKAVALAPAGSYLLFLGAGDRLRWIPSRTEFEAWRRDGVRLVFGDAFIGEVRFRSALNGRIRYRNTIHHQALFVLKRSSDDLRWFDQRYNVFADWDFNFQCYNDGVRAVPLGRVVALAAPGGISARTGHLAEIFWLVRRQASLGWAILSVVYHAVMGLRRS
jgi:glycosyltransferase involved in cell wall biosynthesis